MKTRIIIVSTLLSIVVSAYLLMSGKWPSAVQTQQPVSGSIPSVTVPQASQEETDFSSVLTPQDKALLATGYVLTVEEREKLLKKKRAKDLLPTMDELKVMIETPVEFYGQVLDQNDLPVIGADITCNWTTPGSWGFNGPGYSPRKLRSKAPAGNFEITGLNASAVTIIVDPPQGYSQLPESTNRIQFAETPERIAQNADYKAMTPEQKVLFGTMHGFGQAHKPDKAKPVIFRLKKL